MSRAKTEKAASIKLDDDAIRRHIDESLATLAQLCEIYDNGRPYIAFNIATEIARILTDNAVAAKLRSGRLFGSTQVELLPSNLTAQNTLTVMRIDNRTPHIDFIPWFQYEPYKARKLKFADWWNRDVIWVAGAAKPGLSMDIIPLREAEQVPYVKRRRLVRRELILMMRNKLGAHLDTEIPELLDELQRANIFGMAASAETPLGVFNTWDGTLPVRTGPGAAVVRQIAHEVLQAYGSAQ